MPAKVAKGTTVTVHEQLTSPYAPCEQGQEVSIKFGSITKTDTTNASGAFSASQKITKRTRITAFYAGGGGASDQGCGPSQSKKTVRLS